MTHYRDVTCYINLVRNILPQRSNIWPTTYMSTYTLLLIISHKFTLLFSSFQHYHKGQLITYVHHKSKKNVENKILFQKYTCYHVLSILIICITVSFKFHITIKQKISLITKLHKTQPNSIQYGTFFFLVNTCYLIK